MDEGKDQKGRYRYDEYKQHDDSSKKGLAIVGFSMRCYTKYPLNALTNLLARDFAEQGGGRWHTGVCQGRQHRYAEFNAINVKVC